MNEKICMPLLLESDFSALVGRLAAAAVPIISWIVIA
jgi:hypothetical protein